MLVLDLADERLRAARQRFHQAMRHRGRKCRLTFDQLFLLLADGRLSMREIAQRAGVRRQRLYQLFDLYFREFFPNRVKTPGRRKRDLMVDDFKLPGDKCVRHFAEEALARGFLVQRVPVEGRSDRFFPDRLVVNGKSVLVSVARAVFQRRAGDRKYARVARKASSVFRHQVYAVVRAVPGYTITIYSFPVEDLRALVSGDMLYLYFPLEGIPFEHPHVRLDMHDYENAWRFFRE